MRIYVRFQGRLGNRIFQFAYGLALRRRGLDARFLLENDPEWTKHSYSFPPDSTIGTGQVVGDSKLKMITEPENWGEDPQPIDWKELDPSFNYLITGYWQSTRFFEPEVKAEDIFSFINLFPVPIRGGGGLGDFHKIPVSLHVRRGDYVNLTHVFHLLDHTYYVPAVHKIAEVAGVEPSQLIVYIFSDSRVETGLIDKLLETGVDVVEKTSPSDRVDFQRMMWCTHHIIANSSFSWWSAYLRRPGGHVVCPRRWFINNIGAKSAPCPGWPVIP